MYVLSPSKSVEWKSTDLKSILQFVVKVNVIPQYQNYIKNHINKHFLVDIFTPEMLQLKCSTKIYFLIF